MSYPVSFASPDIFECADGKDKCGAHTTCKEKRGSYHCDCDKGFKKNVDQLSCSGKEGSYSCDCDKGFTKNADQLSCSGRAPTWLVPQTEFKTSTCLSTARLGCKLLSIIVSYCLWLVIPNELVSAHVCLPLWFID